MRAVFVCQLYVCTALGIHDLGHGGQRESGHRPPDTAAEILAHDRS